MTSVFSRRHLLRRSAGLAALAAYTSLTASGCSRAPVLACQHQRNGEVYAELDIEHDSLITHSWLHSIENSRWKDTYRFNGESLILSRTEFEEYGAGMPLDEGDVSVQDGRVVVENIDRPFEAIRWIHSHQVDYRIGVDGNESLINADDLPDSEPLELRPR